MMADLGLQTYRFSISWSRVIPDGRGAVNREGLDFYHRLVDLLLANDITPCPTLFHWDLPQGLEEIGGFRSRDTVSWFGDYAELMIRELGDRIPMWSTFNEPWCYAYLGHAAGLHAPGLTDPHAAVTVAHHQLLAHGLALQAMRAERNDLQLGIVINPSNIRSDEQRPAPPDELHLIDAMHNRWWFDATLRGEYPPELLDVVRTSRRRDPARRSRDHRPTARLDRHQLLLRRLHPRHRTRRDARSHRGLSDRRGRRRSPTPPEVHTDMGWPITPDGFTELLVRLHDDYPNLPPVYITENGAAYDDPVVDGRCQDPRRIEYLDAHLRAVKDAIDAGVDIRGYYQWSLMDNFEWALGYDKRFGLVHVDFDTLERTPRDSAHWYREVIRRNGLDSR